MNVPFIESVRLLDETLKKGDLLTFMMYLRRVSLLYS